MVHMFGPHRGYVDGRLQFETSFELVWPLSVRHGQLWSEGQAIGRRLRLEPSRGEVVYWQGRAYRGAITVIAAGSQLRIVNRLGLEDYLRGVVPAEMPANWPLEALKAQAVAARSYTLGTLGSAGDYDICATVECQVYRGVEAEQPQSDRAVAETRGVVLTYNGDIAQTFYHSDSGGMLASSAEVWGQSLPYLTARQDAAGPGPHRGWEFVFDPQALARALRDHGVSMNSVREVEVVSVSESGRVQKVDVIEDGKRVRLEGVLLRDMFRGLGLRSMRFRMRSSLVAQGDGYGHGVGMSQYGARDLALSGYDYGHILAFYYPETRLERLAYLQTQP